MPLKLQTHSFMMRLLPEEEAVSWLKEKVLTAL